MSYVLSIFRLLPKEKLGEFLASHLEQLCAANPTVETRTRLQESYRKQWYNPAWMLGKCLRISATIKLKINSELQDRLVEYCLKTCAWNTWVMESLQVFLEVQRGTAYATRF